MPISYSQNKENGYLDVTCEGLISDRELFRERLTYLSTADWVPGAHELVDFSVADLSEVTPAGIQHLSNILDKLYRNHGLTVVKVAVYTQDVLPSAITSTYSELTKKSVENIRVFYDRRKAESWLCD